jgi:NADPH:quinone reductase-like Zn-dependent oxidoreductase
MRAITFSQFGGPEVLEVSEVDVPSPGPGQIRVRVSACGVNPYDWKVRRGFFGGDLPKRVGMEIAGVVDALGDGVDAVAVGQTVFGLAVGGGAADFALSAHFAPIPAGLDVVTAAGLPVSLETAYRVLDALGVGAGTTLVINGASGAVGQVAVQVAVARGTQVIGTASEANADLVRGLGAEPVLYGSGLVERVHALGVVRADAAFDTSGGGALADLVELTGGTESVVTIADFEGAEALGVTFSGATSAFYAFSDVAELIGDGRLTPAAVKTFALDQVADAQALSETGHAGAKLVLVLWVSQAGAGA